MVIYRQITQNRIFLTLLMLTGTVYTLIYAFIRNPFLPGNTASNIGLEHRFLFFIWNLIIGLAFYYNCTAMYARYKYNSKMGRIFIRSGIICLLVVFIVPTHSEVGFQKVLHFAGAVGYICANSCTFFWFFFIMMKKVKGFSIMLVVSVLLPIYVFIWFFTVGKSGFMELVPMWIGYTMLFSLNCLNVFKVPDSDTP
ncbi:MAG: hypothetical protein FWF08_08315 [Oscillospiraceae bacterium]|nr:hypothetical protein [Oscillospiraceae bacterium]